MMIFCPLTRITPWDQWLDGSAIWMASISPLITTLVSGIGPDGPVIGTASAGVPEDTALNSTEKSSALNTFFMTDPQLCERTHFLPLFKLYTHERRRGGYAADGRTVAPHRNAA